MRKITRFSGNAPAAYIEVREDSGCPKICISYPLDKPVTVEGLWTTAAI